MFRNGYIVSIFIALGCIQFLTNAASAQLKYTDYIGVTVLGNNHLLQRNEGDRLLLTVNDYISRASKTWACDPRSVAKRPFPATNSKNTRCRKTKQPAPTNQQFDTKWNAYNHRYEIGFLRGAKRNLRKARLGLFRKEAGGWTEELGYACEWIVDGNTIEGKKPCRKWITDIETGLHTATVKVFRNDEEVYRAENLEFEIRDILIVAMGDSFGSGEGNPHTHIVFNRDQEIGKFYKPSPAMWLDPRCHRSLLSSSSLATMLLADQNRDKSFSIMNTACSGAETTYGLTKGYAGRLTTKQAHHLWTLTTGNGRPSSDSFKDEGFKGYDGTLVGLKPMNSKDEPAPFDLPSQIDQLAGELSCGDKPCRKPDAILLYMGVNDVGFTSRLVNLILGCDKKPECLAKEQAEIDKGIKQIRAALVDFNNRLKAAELAPESPASIYAMTYPNPMTRPGNGNGKYRYCNADGISFDEDSNTILGNFGALFHLGISENGADWAENAILKPLNNAIRENAAALGWTVIENENSMLGHGYCTDERYFHLFNESELKQGIVPIDFLVDTNNGCDPTVSGHACKGKRSLGLPTGTMHPNIFGHREVAANIVNRLSQDLNLDFKY